MILPPTTADDLSPGKRFAVRSALLVTAILVIALITACSTDSDAASSAAPTGVSVAAPTREVADESLSEPESTVSPSSDPDSSAEQVGSDGESDSADDTGGSPAEPGPSVDSGSDTDSGAEQFGSGGEPDSADETGGSLAEPDPGDDQSSDTDSTTLQFVSDGASDSADETEARLDYAMRFDGDEYGPFESVYLRAAWEQILEAALTPSECPATLPVEYPSGYYTGPLIDTHFHMPPLSDDFGGGGGGSPGGGGADSALYDAIAENDRPLLGTTITLDEVACTLQQEGSTTVFTFFPVYIDGPGALIDLAYNAVERHGPLFVPFIQSTSSEISTVEAEVLEQMLGLRPDLFAGLGEVGDSPTEPINLPPDAPIYVGDFEVVRDHGLMVYFHPGVGDSEALDRALKLFPEVTFLVHGDFIRPYIGDLMAGNSNVYYTFNDIFDEVTPMFRFGDKQDFVDAMERDWEQLLDQAMVHYEDLINEHPDRFMWGTDRADIVWNYHVDIGQLLVKFGRDFIGRLDPAVQDRVAYLNAERLLQ